MKKIAAFFHSPTFFSAFLGALLLYLSFPPVDWWPLAWIAPVPWVLLIRREKLEGPKPYLAIWLAGFTFWLGVLHWLRLPHPLTGIGWVALAFYFAFYVPVFVGVSRSAVHRLRVPAILAAPIVWTGLELVRGHLLSGMTMASLGHTQYRWVMLIQISDLAGAYGVSFLVMFVAACLAVFFFRYNLVRQSRTVPVRQSGNATGLTRPVSEKFRVKNFLPLFYIALAFLVVLGYGYLQLLDGALMRHFHEDDPPLRIALIQESIDTEFGKNDREEIYRRYVVLTAQAVRENKRLDLIVWPETFFRYPILTWDRDAFDRYPEVLRGEGSAENGRRNLAAEAEKTWEEFRKITAEWNVPLLTGLDTWHYTADGILFYNSAAYIGKNGELIGRYDKMHPVMFGEYIPLADRIAWLNRITPLSAGLTPGERPKSFRLKNLRFSPDICYESVLPHLIRRQILTLRAEGEEPDFLVNLTNGGWYWGSSELDLHLACGVFRAVECRKPLLIAANTGFSAVINGDGRILIKGRRRDTDILLAEVRRDPRGSWYLDHGDWFAGACLWACILFVLGGILQGWRNRSRGRKGTKKPLAVS
ncbi:MAG: apolipoprotein N-acyltransferase [Pirellulales bacterium]|nr:apolipoprotein N-acyltransferase [Pirellulales bacterium]